MKILVVSDIHACASDQPDASQRSYVNAGQGFSSSPTEEFITLIDGHPDFRPDVVVCCGDMGDQANPTGLQHAWKFLNELVKLSSAPLLLATAGNHDLDSRFQHSDYDAKGTLQDLNPPFPVVCLDGPFLSKEEIERKALHFWADNFYMVVKDAVRFVVLNSSAFHGYGKISENGDLLEYEHGRISELTIKRMTKMLQDQNEKLEDGEVVINVLICHHHLEKDGSVDDPDYSSMRGAHALVDMLSDSDIGRWLVIHGHRHRPRLYQTNDSTGPFVLSAASFGATKLGDPQNPSPNQAHLINLDLDEMKKRRFLPAGSIKSLSRPPGMAWSNTYYASGGLPPSSNFGFRGSVDELAADVNDAIVGKTPMKWDDLSKKIPKISYLHYKQLEELNKCLKKYYSMEILFDDSKNPTDCGRNP